MTKLLSTEQMAEFANSGCLFFEGLIDEDINKEFLNDIGHTDIDDVDNIQHYFQNIKSSSSIPRIPCLLYTSPSPRDSMTSRMPSSA